MMIRSRCMCPYGSTMRWRMAIMMGIASRVGLLLSLVLLLIFDAALWPLFHYLLWQDIASEDVSQDAHYTAYAAANRAFAGACFILPFFESNRVYPQTQSPPYTARATSSGYTTTS